jgi:hypothetical protein
MYSKGAMVFKLLRDTLALRSLISCSKTTQGVQGKSASIDDFEKLATQIAASRCDISLQDGSRVRVFPNLRAIT